ncbi:hypothetical protein SLS56_007832 [Neofusicoccum ribis]|uniref:CFEM domain-containing protein n=1 Tax=Neofusicoccum ribis TaxID=45134 RepID=A0ABR3SMP1_9PEZI
MKFFSTIAMTIMVSSATAAYTAADMPTCAATCAAKFAPQIGCAVDDAKCQCEKSEEFIKVGSDCVYSGCSAADVTKATDVFADVCKSVNGTSTA